MPRVPHSTDDLEAAELELQRAFLHADAGSLEALLDDEAEFSWLDGTLLAKDAFIETYRSGRMRLSRFEVERSRVRVLEELGLTDVIATIAGHDAGEPFELRLRFQRTWKLADDWTVVSAHASVVRPGRLPPARSR